MNNSVEKNVIMQKNNIIVNKKRLIPMSREERLKSAKNVKEKLPAINVKRDLSMHSNENPNLVNVSTENSAQNSPVNNKINANNIHAYVSPNKQVNNARIPDLMRQYKSNKVSYGMNKYNDQDTIIKNYHHLIRENEMNLLNLKNENQKHNYNSAIAKVNNSQINSHNGNINLSSISYANPSDMSVEPLHTYNKIANYFSENSVEDPVANKKRGIENNIIRILSAHPTSKGDEKKNGSPNNNSILINHGNNYAPLNSNQKKTRLPKIGAHVNNIYKSNISNYHNSVANIKNQKNAVKYNNNEVENVRHYSVDLNQPSHSKLNNNSSDENKIELYNRNNPVIVPKITTSSIEAVK